MSVRVARPDDETSVVALWRACGLVVDANDPVAEFRYALCGACSDILVSEEEGTLVATVMVGHDGHRGWLYYVATAPSHRRRGLGRAIVEAAEIWMLERGVPKAQLLVRETNTQVVSFYEHLGYAVIPRVAMQKVLLAHQSRSSRPGRFAASAKT